MNEREALGKNLKRYREFKGLSRKDLADKIKVSDTTIARLERGEERYTKNFGLSYLLKICKILDTTMEELFMKDSDLLSLRFIISDHNIATLKEVVKIIKELCEK